MPRAATPAQQCVAKAAEEAASAPPQRKEEADACAGVDKNVSCACQLQEILEKAGIDINPTASVDDIVSQLKGKQWNTCTEGNIVGAVAYTQDETDKRSHISAVDTKGCLTHNSGGDGGVIVQTLAAGGEGPCNSDNAGGAQFNLEWAKRVKYLCPPPSEGANCNP